MLTFQKNEDMSTSSDSGLGAAGIDSGIFFRVVVSTPEPVTHMLPGGDEDGSTVLGEEHPFTLATMANLASTYQLQERWLEMERLEIEVLEKRRRILGEHHPATLSSMANLAFTDSKQGKWQESERRDKEVIKDW